MNLQDISTQLLFTTVPVWAERADKTVNTGTGFIFNATFSGNPSHAIPFLVTNHHVVKDAVRGLAEFNERMPDGSPNVEKRVRVEIDQVSLTAFSDAQLDIAVVPLGPVVNQLESISRPVFFRAIDPSLLPEKEALNKLAAIESVVFIGYPSGLRDQKNNMPLVRRGITSTPVWNDFEGEPAFLIDAGVFPGSSGSPVFIFDQGSYASGPDVVIGSRLLFLGMIKESMIANKTGQFIGIGRVLRSDAIDRFISNVTMKPQFQRT